MDVTPVSVESRAGLRRACGTVAARPELGLVPGGAVAAMSLPLRIFGSFLLLLALLAVPTALEAHAVGENYVWLNAEEDRFSGRFEIQLTDLERQFGWELPGEFDPALQQLVERVPEVQSYLRERFSIAREGRTIPFTFTDTELTEAGELLFAQFHFQTAPGSRAEVVEVENRVLLDLDRTHRSLLCIQYDRQRDKDYGEEFTALVFSRANPRQTFDLGNIEGILRVRDFVWQGVLHIWIGLDHILFLVALLLTAVLRRSEGESGLSAWRPVEDFRGALWNVVRIVTLFTIAHSITLALAALDFVSLPSRLVESVIALSILLVALNNLFPKVRETSWLIVFFGLFHGLGFASVMGELPFRMGNLMQIVLAFNIGVELGQVAIVAALFPLLYLLRRTAIYKPGVLVGGSIAVGALAAWWFVTRALGIG